MISPGDIDQLSYQARFGSTDERLSARQSIRDAAAAAGLRLASIRPLYLARASGAVGGWTVPAMNIRGLAYEFCRAVFRAAKATQTAAFVLEIARSEMEYTAQRPDEIASVVLAAALREGYTGPVFLQGDHYKVQPGKSGELIAPEVQAIKQLIDESLAAGFFNIDIDASTTVDLSRPTPREQQYQNGSVTAQLTKHIRARQPIDVAVGGEIGEIGGQVSTVDDLRAFMDVYRSEVGTLDQIGKVAIQTGTSHGGTPTADGRVAEVKVDFAAIEAISKVAREEFGLAGVVQHGASTLPEDSLGRFVDAGCVEIHLSTEFQNIIFNHPDFPDDVMSEMREYLGQHWSSERQDGMTDAQFFYKARKRAWGPFKQRLADLPEQTRAAIGQSLEDKVRRIFEILRVSQTRSVVDRYVS
ncbi:MAG: class II fructose-bisphosphate aldolase [Candidatus Kerfeldbacteria bacterium]|nr:class II fructose-bisphosphate aldolase [Candidatus Kerfeldbacteria bacterium]